MALVSAERSPEGRAPTIAGSSGALAPSLRSSLSIFCLAFIYTALAALAIQTVILPHLLPGLHAGHGLMVGHDSVMFDALADQMATRIQTHGWSAWTLVPNLQGVVGIAAAAYAITGVHLPLVLIPIYSVLYALSTTCIYRITRVLSESERGAWLAAAAFLLFPSAAQIYADLHKDAWTSAGVLLLVGAVVDLQQVQRPRARALARFVVVVGAGIALIWVMRPYLIKLMLGGIVLGLLALLAAKALQRRGSSADLPRFGGYLLLVLMMSAACLLSTAPLMDSAIRKPSFIIRAQPPGVTTRTADEAGHAAPARTELASQSLLFRHTIGAILSVREGVLDTPGGSIVDADVRFPSIQALLIYLPRALQIGLLAPFPDMWFERGMSPGARIMRLVSGLEMSIAYILLLGWIFLVPRTTSDRADALLFVTVTSLAVLLVLSLAEPNVGTLYRMRYPLFMLIVGLGGAGWTMVGTKSRQTERGTRASAT